jgi:hypothetical protein
MASPSPQMASKLIFSYDKNSIVNGRYSGKYTPTTLQKWIILADTIKIYNFFNGADNINPVFDHQDNFYFVSDRDGMRNLYKYDRTNGAKVYQMTDLLTGISGISGISPAITASSKKGQSALHTLLR